VAVRPSYIYDTWCLKVNLIYKISARS